MEGIEGACIPIAIHYEAETILISSSCNIKQSDIIYNVANESSIAYDSKLLLFSMIRLFIGLMACFLELMNWTNAFAIWGFTQEVLPRKNVSYPTF